MFGKSSRFVDEEFPYRFFFNGYMGGRLPSLDRVDELVNAGLSELPTGYGVVKWYVKRGKEVVMSGEVEI